MTKEYTVAKCSRHSPNIIKFLIFLHQFFILYIIFDGLLYFEYHLMVVGHILIITNAEYFPVFCIGLTLDFLDHFQLFLFVLLFHYVLMDLCCRLG